MPGTIAAANKSVTGTSKTGPITTSIMDGGIKIPKVPPAVIVPAARRTSYLARVIVFAAIIPNIVTDAPTMPVAAAKIIATNNTAKYNEPRKRASIKRTDSKSRSINPASSIITPIKTNSGTAANVCSSIVELNHSVISQNTVSPKPI